MYRLTGNEKLKRDRQIEREKRDTSSKILSDKGMKIDSIGLCVEILERRLTCNLQEVDAPEGTPGDCP